MQRKSLSEFLANLLKQSKKPQQEPKIIEDSATITQLVGFEDKSSKNNYYSEKKVIALFGNFSILLIVVFTILLLVNLVLTGYLNELKSHTNELVSETDNYAKDIASATDTSQKIAFYKKVYINRILIGNKSKLLFDDLGPGVSIRNTTFSADKFLITVNVAAARNFADLITKYLSSGVVKEISIRRAALVSKDRSFNVDLEGTFK